MENINITGANTMVSSKCPQCAGTMTQQGNTMVCPYCGYHVTSLDQNININQNIHVTSKPQYNLIIHLTGQLNPVVYKYSITNLATKTVVDKGRTTATSTTTALNFSFPQGYYEIKISKYKRTVYLDEMHTVDFQFIYTGKVRHINIVGEVAPQQRPTKEQLAQAAIAPVPVPVPQGNTQQAQPAVQQTVQQQVNVGTQAQAAPQPQPVKSSGRKGVFLVFAIIFTVALIGFIAGGGLPGFIIFTVIGTIVFWGLYFLKDITNAIKKGK